MSASPPTIFTGGKRRRQADLLQLSELPAVAAAYSPLRVKAARKASRVEAAATADRRQVERAHQARRELEARAARLERLGCAGPAREARAKLAKMPAPSQELTSLTTALAAPRTTLPFPASAGPKAVGSELRSVHSASASTAALDAGDLDFTAGLDLLPPGEQRAQVVPAGMDHPAQPRVGLATQQLWRRGRHQRPAASLWTVHGATWVGWRVSQGGSRGGEAGSTEDEQDLPPSRCVGLW